MEARFKRMRQLFGRRGVQFEVPDYQRGYEWEDKHFEDLWNDIQRIGDGVDFHYLGNVILRRKESGDVMEIVDGQQRMVTLSLLMMAIRDSEISESDDPRIEDFLYCFKSTEREKKILLSDTHARSQFDDAWNGDTDDLEGSIGAAYSFYKSRVEELSEDEADELMTKVSKSLRVVETIAEDTRIAYMIFQSQNERGTEVAPEILAKARIFGEAENLDDDHERRRIVGRWDAIYKQFRRELDGPRFRSDLRIRRPLAQILVNSEYRTPTKIDRRDLYRNFDEILRKHSDISEFVEWFQEQADRYIELSSNSYEINSRNIPSDAQRYLQYLNSVSTHSEVLSLAIYNRVDDDTLLKEYFRLAAVLVMRIELAGYASAAKRDALYNTARDVREAEDVNSIRTALKEAISNETPTDPEIFEHLKANDLNIRGSWNFRTLLKLVSIEEARRRGHSKLEIDKLDIEHIAPRNSYGNSKYSAWRRNLDEEEYDDRKDMLGNLTLLLPSDHSSLDETSFSDKKNAYTNSEMKIAEEIAEYDDWGDEEIDERTKRLARELTEVWSV